MRGALEVVELEAGLFLRPGDGGLDLDGRQAGGHGVEATARPRRSCARRGRCGGQLEEGGFDAAVEELRV